jgi:uncharacterized protein
MKLFDQLNEAQLRALIETLPLELTIIDDKDEVVGWNKDEGRLFRRPLPSMGLNYRDCHPKESLPQVVQIVEQMRQGTRDRARFWIDMGVGPAGADGKPPRHKILIEFYALRDEKGGYLGCMECAQDVQEIRELEGERRIMDPHA